MSVLVRDVEVWQMMRDGGASVCICIYASMWRHIVSVRHFWNYLGHSGLIFNFTVVSYSNAGILKSWRHLQLISSD